MKINAITTALAGLALLMSTTLKAQNEVKEQLVVPLSDPGKSGRLEASLINGSIHVQPHNGKDVIIDAVMVQRSDQSKHKGREDELASGMKKISTRGGIEMTAEERNNNVKVSTQSFKNNMQLDIKVPQNFSLKLHTINNGDILVENINGELEISNVNGPITLNNVSGSAVVNTINGNLKATFKSLNNDTPMAFSTLNGNIDVTFPASAKFNAKLKSDRGDIYSDFDVDVDKSQPRSNRSSENGMYKVSIDDWVQGKVNGGGREVMMKNMHGSIYIRKAK